MELVRITLFMFFLGVSAWLWLSIRPGFREIFSSRLVKKRPPAMARLVARSGPRPGQQFGLTASRNIIGRDATRCNIVLDDRAVSAVHAAVVFENGRFVLYDLASACGTYVNNANVGRALLEVCPINS